ncbi:MAG TPA: CHAT domain-containing protein [Anaerolineae bacterium]|nr:CHAT domain-containing protein [Anaerolineae bacterium]HQH38618.1 CHAT domain-containing protein [Anaerolineae bacterium]
MPKTAQRSYTDLLVRIHARDEARQCYPVEAWMNEAVHFADGEMHIDHETLEATENTPVTYGQTLFYALFSGPIRRAYDRAIGYAEARTNGQLRLRLWIDPHAPELHALAWERLHFLKENTPSPMAATVQMPFSRYSGLEVAESMPITARPIRMLVAIANPADLIDLRMAPIAVEQEVESLVAALSGLQRTGQLHVTLLPGRTGLSDAVHARLEQAGYTLLDGNTTLDTLIRELSTAPGYHILHFLGHGAFSSTQGVTTLFLEDADGYADPQKDADFVNPIAALDPPPHLIFMAACESAKRDPHNGNPYIGLAPQLVQAGIPAIVAMQDTITPQNARELSQDFYRHLLEHGVVDRAMNQARLLLLENGEAAWAVPALFMRLENGQLFAADPVRSALRAMLQADVFNPLAEGGAYLPLEVRHFSGGSPAVDFDALTQENTPGPGLVETVLDILAPIKQEQGPHGPSTIALVGDAGMGKSTAMRHIGQMTAQQSLEDDATALVIPVYVDLQNLPPNARLDEKGLETMILQAMEPFLEAAPEDYPRDLLKAYTGPTLRILLDNSEVLPYHSRRRFCAALQDFVRHHPRHAYMVAFNTDDFDVAPLSISDTLIMLPLSERNIQRYLTQTLDLPHARQLYAGLEEVQLFDLARIPWLLFKMLQQAVEGKTPTSHAQVLHDLVDDAIAEVATDQGMRTRATKTLYALAWEMQSTGRNALTIDEAFEIMAATRGNRGYSLESLYQELTAYGLLAPVGEESLRFARANIRAYCCAQALLARDDFDSVLSDIVATLGRYTRYYWWEETLTLLSGLMDSPIDLIQEILYGIALTEGEQVFLAANCIRECQGKCADEQLLNYIVSALLWRLDRTREPHVMRRVRIVQALGQLKHPAAIPRLVEIAHKPVQCAASGEPTYEDSDVRLAAVIALRRMLAPPYTEIETLAPQLAEVLNHWAKAQVKALVPYLVAREGQDIGIQATAAFALGDLKTDVAARVLVRAFLSPHFSHETRSVAATALTLLNPEWVMQQAILPFLSAEVAEQQRLNPLTQANREQWYPHLAYLIGKIRPQDGRARAFLYRCLNEFPDVTLKGIAIQSIGWLYDTTAALQFTDITLEDFSSLNLKAPLAPDEAHYLQHKALDALYYIGNDETLQRLQRHTVAWSPDLENAFYRTVERISSRQNQQ